MAFGRSMLFGNGLSALLTLLGISAALVVLFVIGPLALAGRGAARPRGWLAWLVYFGALGAGFMLDRGRPCCSASCCCSATRSIR